MRGRVIENVLERKKLPLAPQDLEDAPFPDRFPPGTHVWVSTKALPAEAHGTRATKPKGTGPFKIISWDPSGMSAQLQHVQTGQEITRNVRFLCPVNAPLEDAVAPNEYVVEEILGERYESKTKSTSYLIHFKGFGCDRPEWIESKNLNCPDILALWKARPKADRRKRTAETVAKLEQVVSPKLSYC